MKLAYSQIPENHFFVIIFTKIMLDAHFNFNQQFERIGHKYRITFII